MQSIHINRSIVSHIIAWGTHNFMNPQSHVKTFRWKACGFLGCPWGVLALNPWSSSERTCDVWPFSGSPRLNQMGEHYRTSSRGALGWTSQGPLGPADRTSSRGALGWTSQGPSGASRQDALSRACLVSAEKTRAPRAKEWDGPV